MIVIRDALELAPYAVSEFEAEISMVEANAVHSWLRPKRLWVKRPSAFNSDWSNAKDFLLDDNPHWQVWIDWYEARLRSSPVNKEVELARILIADEIWEAGVEATAEKVQSLLFSNLPEGDSKKALEQRPAAFKFRVDQNKIDAAPEDAKSIDEDTSDDIYCETKRKATSLRGRLDRIQADQRVRANVELLITRLGASSSELRPGLILSTLRSLQSDVHAFDTEEGRRELAPADLALLIDLAETTRDLAAMFPKSREIEAETISLGLPMEKLDEVQRHVESVVKSVISSDGATLDAKEAVRDTFTTAKKARSTAEKAKQLAYSLLDIGNLARAGLSYVKESGEKLKIDSLGTAASIAKNEIGSLGLDGWRGVRRGFPRGTEAGAREAGKMLIVGGASVLMAHLVGPIAALGPFIAAYAPLGKIANDLSARDADDAEVADDSNEDLSTPTPSEPAVIESPVRSLRKSVRRRSKKPK